MLRAVADQLRRNFHSSTGVKISESEMKAVIRDIQDELPAGVQEKLEIS